MLDFSKIKTYPIKERKNKVQVKDLSLGVATEPSFAAFWDSLPPLLAAGRIKELVGKIQEARKKGRPIVWMMGAHVIKCGLSRFLIELMEEGYLTALALNGAGGIHDFELACHGGTSEEVADTLRNGTFGMVEETGRDMNRAIKKGAASGLGLGRSLGEYLDKIDPPHKEISLVHSAYRLNIPLTIHVAVGTDIIHQHPECDGAAIGAASYNDFKTFAEVVSGLGDGGVLLNIGSAVILPEVFLKALTVARNLGHPVKDFSSANFDMISHYRPAENVVRRPLLDGGSGYTITGHHEIMIPLLATALLNRR